MKKSIRILIVHAESEVSEGIRKMLLNEGYQVKTCPDSESATQLLKQELFNFVLLSATLPEENQLPLMQFVKDYCPDTLTIPISWHAVLKSAVEALRFSPPEKSGSPGNLKAMKMTIERLSRNILRRNSEKENRRKAMIMAQDLQESNLRLMELDRKKNRCLAVATHEMRTPLTIINGYMKMLMDESFGELNENQKHLLRESKSNCDRLLELVNSMLDRCRLESGSVEYNVQEGPYLQVVHQVVQRMRHYVEKNGLTVKEDFPEGEIYVPIDAAAIEQALVNLLSNAVKFTSPSGEITLRCREKSDGVLTQVIDTGVGIAPEEIDEVFTEFNEVGKKYGEKKGAGLGLSICRKIIAVHRGEIWVESTPGQGSCFSFLLPKQKEIRTLQG
jgi:signal transduction histidine kinase